MASTSVKLAAWPVVKQSVPSGANFTLPAECDMPSAGMQSALAGRERHPVLSPFARGPTCEPRMTVSLLTGAVSPGTRNAGEQGPSGDTPPDDAADRAPAAGHRRAAAAE